MDSNTFNIPIRFDGTSVALILLLLVKSYSAPSCVCMYKTKEWLRVVLSSVFFIGCGWGMYIITVWGGHVTAFRMNGKTNDVLTWCVLSY